MKKEYFEILLENMNDKFEMVLEGQAALDRKIDIKFEELNDKIDLNTLKIDALKVKVDENSQKIDTLSKKVDENSRKIDAVAADLRAHREDTEAHSSMYRVKHP